jgi:hypothetical protein
LTHSPSSFWTRRFTRTRQLTNGPGVDRFPLGCGLVGQYEALPIGHDPSCSKDQARFGEVGQGAAGRLHGTLDQVPHLRCRAELDAFGAGPR